MIFLRRPIDKLSSSPEAHPTFMHPAFCPGSSHHRPTFAVFVTETPSDDDTATTRMGNTTCRNNKTCGADKEYEKMRDFLKTQLHHANANNSNNNTAKTPSPKHGLHHSFQYQRQPQQATTTTTTTVPKPTNVAAAADNHNNNTVVVEKPRIQQTESNERISIALDVAGYTLNDLQIKIDGRILTIAGRRHNRIGMTFTFSRRLGLKIARLEMETLRANLVEGVLEVTVDKKKIPQQNKMSRVIPITSISAARTTTTTTSSDDNHSGGNDTAQEAKSRVDEPSSATKDNSSITDQHQQPEAESVGSVEGEESTSGRTSSLGSVATPVETVTEQDDDDDDDSDTPSSSSMSADKQGQSTYAEDDEKANVEEEASATTSENNHRSGSEEEEQPDGESWENVVIDMFGDGK